MKNILWSKSENNILREQYLKGISLKQISLNMGRSHAAISNQLTRAGIRAIKPRIQRIPCGPKKKNQLRRKKTLLLREWYFLEEVIHWLIKEGFKLGHFNWNGSDWFSIDGVKMSSSAFLMFANEKRVEKNLRIFFVDGITQE